VSDRAENGTIRARVTVVVDVPDDGATLESVRSSVTRSLRDDSEQIGARVISVDVVAVPGSSGDTRPMQPVDRYGRTFWESASLHQLAAEQGVEPIRDIRELAGGFWPEDEGPDEFVNWLREQRRRG
jgi:hypothetical protein